MFTTHMNHRIYSILIDQISISKPLKYEEKNRETLELEICDNVRFFAPPKAEKEIKPKKNCIANYVDCTVLHNQIMREKCLIVTFQILKMARSVWRKIIRY